jgi:hypothetical protein
MINSRKFKTRSEMEVQEVAAETLIRWMVIWNMATGILMEVKTMRVIVTVSSKTLRWTMTWRVDQTTLNTSVNHLLRWTMKI